MKRISLSSFQIGISLTFLFFIGIGVTGFYLYALPLKEESGEFNQALNQLSWTFGLTSLTGMMALFFALSYRKELIVFREKTSSESSHLQGGQEGEKELKQYTLDPIKKALQHEGTEGIQDGFNALCKQLQAGQGALYAALDNEHLSLQFGYALPVNKSSAISYEFGEGLIGQVAVEKKSLLVDDIPEGYIKVVSGLGSSYPRFLYISPIILQDQVKGVIEIASFHPFPEETQKFIQNCSSLFSEKLN